MPVNVLAQLSIFEDLLDPLLIRHIPEVIHCLVEQFVLDWSGVSECCWMDRRYFLVVLEECNSAFALCIDQLQYSLP